MRVLVESSCGGGDGEEVDTSGILWLEPRS